jgi:hypothetical protein
LRLPLHFIPEPNPLRRGFFQVGNHLMALPRLRFAERDMPADVRSRIGPERRRRLITDDWGFFLSDGGAVSFLVIIPLFRRHKGSLSRRLQTSTGSMGRDRRRCRHGRAPIGVLGPGSLRRLHHVLDRSVAVGAGVQLRGLFAGMEPASPGALRRTWTSSAGVDPGPTTSGGRGLQLNRTPSQAALVAAPR